jgi:maltose alpha-D-glucosyltransferase/alpha-amylase
LSRGRELPIDPALGSLGDSAELMNAADKRGLRLVLGLVLNHTSDEHPGPCRPLS